jgi:hypothetical protein
MIPQGVLAGAFARTSLSSGIVIVVDFKRPYDVSLVCQKKILIEDQRLTGNCLW